MDRRQFLTLAGSGVSPLLAGCFSSSQSTPQEQLVGATVSAHPGEQVTIPFKMTATGASRIKADNPVLSVDLKYFPPLSFAADAAVANQWATDYEDWTAWTPESAVGPGETVVASLPVTIAEDARGMYTLRGRRLDSGATASARLRVPPVPSEPSVAVTASGGLGGFTMTGPPPESVIAGPICPADTARVLFFLHNNSESRLDTITLKITSPEEWDVAETNHAESWLATDSAWRLSALSPGRYRWYRIDFTPPETLMDRVTYQIDGTVSTTAGASAMASTSIVVDPDHSSSLSVCDA